MKDTPTSGPMPRSSTHHARDTRSSRHSLSRSQSHGGLGERKKHLFQVLRRLCQRGELRHGTLAAHASAGEQHEAITVARGVADLVYGEKYGAAAFDMGAKRSGDVARLAKVEAV